MPCYFHSWQRGPGDILGCKYPKWEGEYLERGKRGIMVWFGQLTILIIFHIIAHHRIAFAFWYLQVKDTLAEEE